MSDLRTGPTAAIPGVAAQEKDNFMLDYFKLILLAVIALLAALAANGAQDAAYQFHAIIITLVAIGMFVYQLRHTNDPPKLVDTGYMDGVVRAGVIATAFWGLAGFLVGTYIAFQLAFPFLNLDLPWTTFGRLRPLHTSAVIFAFGGNALIATSFYICLLYTSDAADDR